MPSNNAPAGITEKPFAGWLVYLETINTTIVKADFSTGTRNDLLGMVANEDMTVMIDNANAYLTKHGYGENNPVATFTGGTYFETSFTIHEIGKWSLAEMLGNTLTATGTLATDGEAGGLKVDPRAGKRVTPKRFVFIPNYASEAGTFVTNEDDTNNKFMFEIPYGIVDGGIEITYPTNGEPANVPITLKGETGYNGEAPFKMGSDVVLTVTP